MPEIVEIPVVWLQGAACTGCAVSLLNSFSPAVAPVLLKELAPGKHLSLRFLATVMAGQGPQVIEVLRDTAARAKGGYFLVMEGSIQLGDPMFATLGEEKGREVPISERAADLARSAAAVVNMGTCASFGGVPAGAPNPTQAVSMVEFLCAQGIPTPVINIPGCPPHPDWLLGTLTAVAMQGLGPVAATLDDLRPAGDVFRQVHPRDVPAPGRFRRRPLRQKVRRQRMPVRTGMQGAGHLCRLPHAHVEQRHQLVHRLGRPVPRVRRAGLSRPPEPAVSETERGAAGPVPPAPASASGLIAEVDVWTVPERAVAARKRSPSTR